MAIQNNNFKLKSYKPALVIASGIFILVGVTATTGAILTNTTGGIYTGFHKASALDSGGAVTTTSINVVDSCTISKTNESTSDSVTIPTGTYNDHVKETTIAIICNDPDGYDVYAIGYSNDTEGNTNMLNLADKSVTFPTGLATSGLQSNWSMKVAAVTDGSASTYAPLIQNDFDNFSLIPDQSTIIAAYDSAIDGSIGSSFTTTYAAFVTYDQQPGTYEGKVKYTLSHSSVTDFKTYMQDLDSTNIALLLPNVGDTATVYDRRDEQAYLIGKLADNNYWMLDNLMLGVNTLAEPISSDNTNITPDVSFTLPTTSTTSGFSSYTTAQINKEYANNVTTSYGPGSGKVGIYYNYCAASAGDICVAENLNNRDGSPDRDICPRNWRIPTGGPTTGEYWKLCTAILGSNCATSGAQSMTATSVASLQHQLSTPLAGFFFDKTQNSFGGSGAFWSSTRGSDKSMYYLIALPSSIYPQYNERRDDGFFIRCLLK